MNCREIPKDSRKVNKKFGFYIFYVNFTHVQIFIYVRKGISHTVFHISHRAPSYISLLTQGIKKGNMRGNNNKMTYFKLLWEI